MRNFSIYKTLFLFLFAFAAARVEAQGGLMFNSNDSIIGKRTSYNVFENITPVFKNHFYINFELSLWDTQYLGYIFILVTKTNSYSFNYVYNEGSAHLNFNIVNKSNKLSYALSPSRLTKRNFFKVKFDFDLKNDDAIVCIDNQKYKLSNLGIANDIQPKLVFGENKYFIEVTHMAIRNLTVGDDNKAYFFPLNEWKGNAVHNNSGEAIGNVENPIWLANESFFWTPVYNHTFNEVKGLNFDPINQKLFVFGKDSIIFFDSTATRTTSLAYKNPLPIPMVLGKNIFNTKENKLYAYEVYNDKKDEVSIAALDMKTLQWQTIGRAALTEQRHHHNVFYDANQDSFFIFGGYGGFAYHNVFYTYNSKEDKWKPVQFTGDTITPRFFSASGNSEKPNEIFIFGGYGNKSGNQIIGGQQYYDLYRVNLQNHTIKKCWEIHLKDVFVPANNLILSADGKYFYTLCYPHETFKTFLLLYRFSVKNGTYEVVSSPIPVTSEHIETDINLFLNKKANTLFCAVDEFRSSHECNIKIYSLAFPPVSNINSINYSGKKAVVPYKWILLALTFLFILAAPIFWMYRKRRGTGRAPLNHSEEKEEVNVVANLTIMDQNVEEPRTNAIYLLGEFKVYDKKGMDIGHLFSPKIKQLFILIFLNSNDNDKGIGSKKISNTLWADKDVSKTKNIKGVTLNHLRNILTDIDGIELVFSDDIY